MGRIPFHVFRLQPPPGSLLLLGSPGSSVNEYLNFLAQWAHLLQPARKHDAYRNTSVSSADALHRAFFRDWVAYHRKGKDGLHRGLVAMQGQIFTQLMKYVAQLTNLQRPADSVGVGREVNKEPLGGSEIATIGRVWCTGLCTDDFGRTTIR